MALFHGLISLYFWLLMKTTRCSVLGKEKLILQTQAGKGCVVACAHTVLIPCLIAAKGQQAAFLVSRSRDGEIVSRVLQRWGFVTVRGSSNRGGVASLHTLLECVGKHLTVAIAIDGPKGPPLKVKPGITACAVRASGSTFFVSMAPGPGVRGRLMFRVGSWDRLLIPLPFASMVIRFEEIYEPIAAATKDDQRMIAHNIEERCRCLYGHLYGESS